MAKAMTAAERGAFLALEHVGPATVRDLELLGVRRLEQLARRDPEALYERLSKLTGRRQDPCVLDVFSMLVSRARGEKPRPWWEFSRERLAAADPASRGPRKARRRAAPARRVSAARGARA
jgi:hypothetical protein